MMFAARPGSKTFVNASTSKGFLMLTITCILAFAALIMAIVNLANGKPPLPVAVILIAIALLLTCLPIK